MLLIFKTKKIRFKTKLNSMDHLTPDQKRYQRRQQMLHISPSLKMEAFWVMWQKKMQRKIQRDMQRKQQTAAAAAEAM